MTEKFLRFHVWVTGNQLQQPEIDKESRENHIARGVKGLTDGIYRRWTLKVRGVSLQGSYYTVPGSGQQAAQRNLGMKEISIFQ